MNANELRIGNYLSHKYDPVVGKPGLLEVVEVKYNHTRVEYQLNGRTRTSCVEYADLEGKPLTEEWLLRLGFKKEKPSGWWGKGHIKIFSPNENPTEFELGDYGLIIKYVHQLQNLYFALTGEELTAN